MTPAQKEELIAHYLCAAGLLVGSAGARMVGHLFDLAEAGMLARGKAEMLGTLQFFRSFVWTPAAYGTLAGSAWFLYRGHKREQAIRGRTDQTMRRGPH